MFSWKTREKYIYIYIYRERERERERAVLVDKKKTYNVVCVGTKKHTQTHYMNSVM